MGVGTNLKFYVEDGGDYYDITPLRIPVSTNTTTFAANTVAPFSVFIAVTDSSASSLQVGDFVTFSNAAGLGGNITAGILNQEYQIQEISSGTTYTIAARTAGESINGYNFLVNTTDSTITLPTGTAMANGNTVVLLIGVSPPVGLNYAVTYYLVNVIGTTCQLSLTSGGTPIALTSEGVGLQALYFTVKSNASDISNGGAATDAEYQINTGFPVYVIGTGWGTGPWSRGSWGSGFTTGTGLQLRLWSQSNFGEELLFSYRGGPLYLWQPGAGATPAFGTRGTLVSGTDVPSQINQILVSDTSRIVIEQESYTGWTPASTNQAGSYRLSRGSEIVGALQTRQEIVVWTDAAIYAMQYIGPPFVYGFTLLSDNISLVSPNAVATAAGVVYWMGVDKFYMYAGRVETLPCSVRQFIFNDINNTQQAQFNAGTSEGYSEVWWHYCSKNSDTIDRYVIFNYLDRVWYYGTLDRTAWLDSPLREYPMAATTKNIVVFHEAAVDDGSTNPPSPIDSYIQSSDFDIADGHNYGFVWRIIPDITFDGSNTTGTTTDKPFVQFTVRPRQNPGADYGVTSSPTVTSAENYSGRTTYNVQEFTQIIYSRVRGRQMAFKVESNSIGTQWQLGVPRIDVRPDGRR
jgi:hypothetical protein